MTTSTHSHHGYRLIVHHESYDRYRVAISDPKASKFSHTARTWSDKAFRDTSITFSPNDGPHKTRDQQAEGRCHPTKRAP